MVWLKRIGIAFGIIGIVIAVAHFALMRYAETYSFAPGDPEQAQLAAEHAECAGYYTVVLVFLKKENPDYAQLEKQYTKEIKHHVRMGRNFSPDKTEFDEQVVKGASQFIDAGVNAAKTEKVPELVDKKGLQCLRTASRSADFVMRKLEERSR